MRKVRDSRSGPACGGCRNEFRYDLSSSASFIPAARFRLNQTFPRSSDDCSKLATGAHDLQRRQIKPVPAQVEIHRSVLVRVRR